MNHPIAHAQPVKVFRRCVDERSMVAQHSDLGTDSAPVALRRRLAADLIPHLVAIRNLTDPSAVISRAACHPVRYGVAAEPLRGPVQRAMGMVWRCTSVSSAARNIEVEHLNTIGSLVQVHGVDWSLVARTGCSSLLLFDGYPIAVVDVSSTDLIGSLVAGLLRAAQRRLDELQQGVHHHRDHPPSRQAVHDAPPPPPPPPPAPPRRQWVPSPAAPSGWVPEQRNDTGEWPRARPPMQPPVPTAWRDGPRHGR